MSLFDTGVLNVLQNYPSMIYSKWKIHLKTMFELVNSTEVNLNGISIKSNKKKLCKSFSDLH